MKEYNVKVTNLILNSSSLSVWEFGLRNCYCFSLSLKRNEVKSSKPSEPYWGKGRAVLIGRGQRTPTHGHSLRVLSAESYHITLFPRGQRLEESSYFPQISLLP